MGTTEVERGPNLVQKYFYHKNVILFKLVKLECLLMGIYRCITVI